MANGHTSVHRRARFAVIDATSCIANPVHAEVVPTSNRFTRHGELPVVVEQNGGLEVDAF